MFVRFSEKIGLVFFLVRVIAIKFYFVYSSLVFFNIYCVLVCVFFCMIYIPNPYKNWIKKYHDTLVLAYKISLIFCLFLWILCLVLMAKYTHRIYTHTIVEDYFSWSELLLYFIIKVVLLFYFIALFILRFLRTLFVNLVQPAYLYRQYRLHFSSVVFLLFLIFEILLMPLTLVFYVIQNCWLKVKTI